VVLMVRHAEKGDDGTPDPPLSKAGEARASCLATMLTPFAPDHLFATEYRRTQATLGPLAEATGQEIEVHSASDADGWVQLLRDLPSGSRAVVAGHSNTVPGLLQALGGAPSGLNKKGHLPHEEYDRLVHVMLDAKGRVISSYRVSYCGD